MLRQLREVLDDLDKEPKKVEKVTEHGDFSASRVARSGGRLSTLQSFWICEGVRRTRIREALDSIKGRGVPLREYGSCAMQLMTLCTTQDLVDIVDAAVATEETRAL
eukprot:scaffold7326_cov249-Pinguiococcus_pyrenoidosus.AAC.12